MERVCVLQVELAAAAGDAEARVEAAREDAEERLQQLQEERTKLNDMEVAMVQSSSQRFLSVSPVYLEFLSLVQ